jgi:phosphoribosylanthranilate isomerase
MKIKICGITNKEDALNAVSLGAHALGFIFSKNSPRYVSPEIVEELSLLLPPFVLLVGVFVNHSAEEIKDIVERCKLDIIQLHGSESAEFCLKMKKRVIKAIKVSEPEDLEQIHQYHGTVSAILLDTKIKNIEGGTGKTFDWGLAIKAKEHDIPIILAGGINASNINKAVQLVNPYGIDLSSGVENTPGKKDYNKMRDVMTMAREL